MNTSVRVLFRYWTHGFSDVGHTYVNVYRMVLHQWIRLVHGVVNQFIELLSVPSFHGVGTADDVSDLNDSTVNGKVEFITEVSDAEEDTVDPSATGISFVFAFTVCNQPEAMLAEFKY